MVISRRSAIFIGVASLASISAAFPALAAFEPFIGDWRCTSFAQGGEAARTAGRFSFTMNGRYEWRFDEKIPHLTRSEKGRWTFAPVDGNLRMKSNSLLTRLLAPPGFKHINARFLSGETPDDVTLSIASIYGMEFYSPLNLSLERES
jgi:hypothetical protein